MGKGDRKTRRGKIWMGTFGVRRKRKRKKALFIPVPQRRRKLPEEVVQPRIAETLPVVETAIPAVQQVLEPVTVEAPVTEKEILETVTAVHQETVAEQPDTQPVQAVVEVPAKEKIPAKKSTAKPAKKIPAKKQGAAKKTAAKATAAKQEEPQKAEKSGEKKKRGRPAKSKQ